MDQTANELHTSETILQFGTGILLRGLPDYFVQKGNQTTETPQRIVVVKSTPGTADEFLAAGCSFTTCIRGISKGSVVKEDFVNEAISRVLTAAGDWQQILEVGANPRLRLIISNTTEVGITLVNETITTQSPASFPAKLLSILHYRFLQLGVAAPLITVVPTELIPDNGKTLRNILLQLMEINHLEGAFEHWLSEHVIFCDSLVDRIVTKPSEQVVKELGEQDPLTIQAEPYRLWAIEGNDRVKKHLSFLCVDDGVIIAEDISYYRERKLRLLNGTHTISVCLGFLKGFDTVYECMQDESMRAIITRVMLEEIQPTLNLGTAAENRDFALEVLDRFANPYTAHRLLSITFQSTAKMKMRIVATLVRYVNKFNTIPTLMVEGFAAYLYFLKAVSFDGKNYFGERKGVQYLIQDDKAGYFMEQWNAFQSGKVELEAMVRTICSDRELWSEDLTLLEGFAGAVAKVLKTWTNED